MNRKISVIIGGAYGDEGKGLATDLFSDEASPVLVIKHNGGAQAGHTVDKTDGRRFVFHALSSGSFRGADTLWTDTFLPDLYKISEELEAFQSVTGSVPKLYACPDTCVTLIDDVLVNMAAETARGGNRHGSCGMGIYEAVLRGKEGFWVTLKQVQDWTAEELADRMREIRRTYLPGRLEALGLRLSELGEYGELLKLDRVLLNAAAEMKRGVGSVTLIGDRKDFLEKYQNIIFESGQGLLLDWDWLPGGPYVSASKTGLTNPLQFLKACDLEPDEVLYVVRSYLTRHGAGPLPFECRAEELGNILRDETNVPNPWQGSLRYSLHPSPVELLCPMVEDACKLSSHTKRSLLITHLNETDGKLKFATGDLTVEAFAGLPEVRHFLDRLYLSDTKYAEDMEVIDVQ
ncbi:MAG: adenylosuccinate synthetase [Acetatifactor sp.]